MENNFNIDNVYDATCKVTGVDISRDYRGDEYIVGKIIYCKICYDNIDIPNRGISEVQRVIGEKINRSRLSVRHSLLNAMYYLEDPVNKRLYNNTLAELGLMKDSKSSGYSETLLNIVNDLKSMNDNQLQEFHETRLKPFKKALESRVNI